MRPIKVGVIQNNKKPIKTERSLNSNIPVGVSSEKYIDYTNFQEGFIMRYDEERNCYYFSSPDNVIDDTFKQEEKPKEFMDSLLGKLEDKVVIDFGEY
jgi:hypothetical protein